jgi:hypothetical protein
MTDDCLWKEPPVPKDPRYAEGNVLDYCQPGDQEYQQLRYQWQFRMSTTAASTGIITVPIHYDTVKLWVSPGDRIPT